MSNLKGSRDLHCWRKNLVNININSRPRPPILGVFLSVCLIAQGTGSDGHNALGISPSGHYINLEGEPYAGDAVRTAIWTFATGGGHYFFHADAGQETVHTGIMGYDPYVPGGDKGTYKRDWIGHASQFFNSCLYNLDAMAPHNELSSSGSYCLADPGREYVVYSMIGSPATVSVNLSATTGKTIDCRFYNPAKGQFEPVFRRTGGSSHESFAKPDERDWALHIVAK